MERNRSFPEDGSMEKVFRSSKNEIKKGTSVLGGNRNSIRTLHKKIRADMKKEDVNEKSRHICELLLKSEWYRNCSVIYGYYPLRNEVDCLPFLIQALRDGKRVALPRTDSFTASMEFYEITSLEQVKEGNFHVMEPIVECPKIQPQNGMCSVMLVPGVVFDIHGNRYGYGKGYYDRYLARFFGLVKTIALAYENQVEQKLDVLDTDILMDYIYTESGIYQDRI